MVCIRERMPDGRLIWALVRLDAAVKLRDLGLVLFLLSGDSAGRLLSAYDMQRLRDARATAAVLQSSLWLVHNSWRRSGKLPKWIFLGALGLGALPDEQCPLLGLGAV